MIEQVVVKVRVRLADAAAARPAGAHPVEMGDTALAAADETRCLHRETETCSGDEYTEEAAAPVATEAGRSDVLGRRRPPTVLQEP